MTPSKKKTIYVAVDFDGTIVEHRYPEIGATVSGALETLTFFLALDVKIILHTMRSGKHLAEAVQFLLEKGIVLHGVNGNPSQSSWTDSPKVYAHFYIDDAAIGCPLIYPPDGERPFVDWDAVRFEFIKRLEHLRSSS